jgi:hypothetical protein
MNLYLSDPSLRPELLAFLRDHGCVAFAGGSGEITALMPELSGSREARTINALTEQWRFAHPLVEVGIVPPLIALGAAS